MTMTPQERADKIIKNFHRPIDGKLRGDWIIFWDDLTKALIESERIGRDAGLKEAAELVVKIDPCLKNEIADAIESLRKGEK